jgi:putative DNA primase/helicase
MNNDLADIGIKVVITTPPSDAEIMESYMPSMWYEDDKGKSHLNENAFAEAFRDVNHLQYNNGLFYTRVGKTTEESLSRDVWESIKDIGIKQDVERTTKKLIGAVKLASTVNGLYTNENLVPFDNGDFYIDTWEFHGDEYSPSPHRLPAPLLLEFETMPNFRKWLNDLFYEDDIKVIQEYLGYCLVPTTKAQKALFLVGEGGAGKSVLGVILEAILGDAMISTPNTQEFLQDKFKLPELEHKLVLYDDDLDNAALSGTGLYKKLITNNLSITADRKYGQPFKFTPCVKLVSCCNEMLTSIYDNTNGFYRRLLPILIKPIAKDFVPDLHFYDKIRAESKGILQWALVGLKRLIDNGWVLSESDRTKEYLSQKKSIGNHFPDFMDAVFEYDEKSNVTTAEVMSLYQVWCRRNACEARKSRAVQTWLTDNAEKYQMVKNNHIVQGGKEVRGYSGIKCKAAWTNSPGKIQLN